MWNSCTVHSAEYVTLLPHCIYCNMLVFALGILLKLVEPSRSRCRPVMGTELIRTLTKGALCMANQVEIRGQWCGGKYSVLRSEKAPVLLEGL